MWDCYSDQSIIWFSFEAGYEEERASQEQDTWRRDGGNREGFVTAVAWYRPHQWQHLREVSSDKDNLEDTYEEWATCAIRVVGELRELGVDLELIEVDIDELVRWCEAKGKRVDGSARSEYAAEKLRLKRQAGQVGPPEV